MHRLTGHTSEPDGFLLIMRNRQQFFILFWPIFPKVCPHAHYIVIIYQHVICVEDSRQAQQTHKNRYQEANSRWCNVTGAQIRAVFLRSLKLRERICPRLVQA